MYAIPDLADKLDTKGVEAERFPWRRQKEKIKESNILEHDSRFFRAI